MTKVQIYQVLHVVSVLLYFALAYSAFAAPTGERRRRLMIATGLLSLVILVTGFGMIHVVYQDHFAVWMFVKMAVWLTLPILMAAAFRQPSKAGLLGWVSAVLAVVAVVMVYLKPFAH